MAHFSSTTIRPLAVITGASSGIGYELAKVFARNGFDLIVAAEDHAIHGAATDFRIYGGNVSAVQVDLSTESGTRELERQIRATGQSVDSLCLNAGIGVWGEFITTAYEREREMIRLNIESVVHLAKLILPSMVERAHGRILVTSSVAAEMPGPYYAVYAATKAFVQSFAEALRVELRPYGITVTALQPGATETNFYERADMMKTRVGQSRKDDPTQVAREGFKALMAGRDHVVAGSFVNKLQSTLAKFISDKQGARLHGAGLKPGSARH